MPEPTCHPDRRHYAKGLCRSCYERNRRRSKLPRRPCALCPRKFQPRDAREMYCSTECQRVAFSERQSVKRGKPTGEQLIALRDRAAAAELVRSLLDRGYKLVHRKRPARSVRRRRYVAIWHRGDGLYLIRARFEVA